jgi:hypothetical protein
MEDTPDRGPGDRLAGRPSAGRGQLAMAVRALDEPAERPERCPRATQLVPSASSSAARTHLAVRARRAPR